MCKHLIQAIGPVPPTFYLEVKRNQTIPFLSHQILQLGGPNCPSSASNVRDSESVDLNKTIPNAGDEELEDDDEDGLIDTESGLAIGDRVTFHQHLLNTLRQSNGSAVA